MVLLLLAAQHPLTSTRKARFDLTDGWKSTDNDEVDDVAIEGATYSVVCVEGCAQAADDGHVDGVDLGGWVVFVLHSSVERSE